MVQEKKGFINKIFNKLQTHSKPEIVFLIGLPGSGKSSFLKQGIQEKRFQNYKICSTDQYIDFVASLRKKTYDDVFDEVYPDAEKQFFKLIDESVKQNQNMVIDRTNCSIQDRKKILERIPSYYKKRAIVFGVPQDELKKRLNVRANATGKVISEEVLQSMINKYEHPTHKEFDHMERY